MTNSIIVFVALAICNGMAVGPADGDPSLLAGQDLHLTAPAMTVCQTVSEDGSQVILLEDGAIVQIGDNLLGSRRAVIHLFPQTSERMPGDVSYLAKAYLEGDISVQRGPKSKTTSVRHFLVEGAEVLTTQFLVTGEVFAVTEAQTAITDKQLATTDLYIRAAEALRQLPTRPPIAQGALVPDIRSIQETAGGPATQPDRSLRAGAAERGGRLKDMREDLVPAVEYPVHLSAVWEPVPHVEERSLPDGRQVITASGRFYLWQKRSEDAIVEFLADEMVLFFDKGQFAIDQEQVTGNQIGFGKVESIYLRGNIVMTEGERTTRADEIYYNFTNQQALVVNASMQMFDEERGLPIYLRAKLLGHVSQSIYEAQDVQLTSSEFYFPQVSMNASKMVLLSDEAVRQYQPPETAADDTASQYEARLYDVNAKYGDFTFFRWPKIATNFKRPDIPISRIRVGSDSEFGTSLETRWHLARLLGFVDPPWLESRLALDYFSDRGVGGGVEAEYEKEDMRGSLIGYVMTDRGEDNLGRTDNRRNLDPDQDIRGRFGLRHRQFLPDDWQLTVEVGYLSDRNFQEWMYRDEFYTDKQQETLIYLKRLRDNWAFSMLAKVRINDFETVTEELPSFEYHLKGQSFWDDRLTFYSDNQAARFRERFDEDRPKGNGEFYTFGYTRNEVDLPLMWESFKFVPFVAGSYSLEDGQGYMVDLDGTTRAPGEDQILLGEVGLRASTMLWKDDPSVRSELWDLNGLRHVVTPYFEAVSYHTNDAAVDMRDTIHVGVNQRWQTHRGSTENQRTVDWMRLDTEATWVTDDAPSSISPVSSMLDPIYGTNTQFYGPASFVYNDPSIPLLLRRDSNFYGLVRDTVTSELVWRVSDTLSLLSDVNYDMNSGHIQQFDIGMSRYVYPDISYYLGTRYLRPLIVNVDEDGDGTDDIHEEGSNSVVAAVTYRLSPRYVATFSQEYNFDYGRAVRSDLTMVRQYHRMFYALSFSFDQSLKRNSVLFSIWPQGVKELAAGSRKYTGLTGSRLED